MSIFAEINNLLVRVEKHTVNSSAVVTKARRWTLKGLDYNYDSSISGGYFTQNLNLYATGTIGSSKYQSNLSFSDVGYGVPVGFQRGNFTLERQRGDVIQFGDLNFRGATDLTFSGTQIRGASYQSGLKFFGKPARYIVYGGLSASGEPDRKILFTDFERRFQRINFDTKVYGAQFSFTRRFYQIEQF